MTVANGEPLITTNGMFIIDDIIDHNGQLHKNIAGGGGMFAMLGGCIASPNSRVAQSLRWIVDCGYDFPESLKERIESWQSGVLFRIDTTRETTRGWNYYAEGDLRQFKYLNEKKSIAAADWKEFGLKSLANIECVHLVCSAKRYSSIVNEMREMDCHPNVLVWEPIPDLCDKAHFEEISKILESNEELTLIFSPNAEECARLLGEREPVTMPETTELIWKLDKLVSNKNVCVLRCGKLGSVSLSSRDDTTGERTLSHFPAYHENDSTKVVDPTGGGNAFLGGFCVGYTATSNLEVANICGNISAGCVIEQLGVPDFDLHTQKWNGLTLSERLDRYLTKKSLTLHNSDEIYRQLSKRWAT